MRRLEIITIPILLFPESYISVFSDHNLEITIDFQGLGWSGLRCEVGLWMPLHPMPRTSDPVCPGPILQSIPPCPSPMYACLHKFIFPLISFRGSGGGLQLTPYVAGGIGCVLGPFLTDYLCYVRHYHCTQWPASLWKCTLVCFPSCPCEGRVRACVVGLQIFWRHFASADA
jgi:hypothetical protein